MAWAVALRSDFTASRMRASARSSRDANQVRRLLALAAIYEGGTRSDAAQLGGVGLQTVRDWVLRFNAAGPDGLIDVAPPGGVPLLDEAQRRALAQIVESGPIPATHGTVHWRLIDLAQWVWHKFAVSISKQTLIRELRAMGHAGQKLEAAVAHIDRLTVEIIRRPDLAGFVILPRRWVVERTWHSSIGVVASPTTRKPPSLRPKRG